MEFVQQNIWLILLWAMSGFMVFSGGLMGKLSGVKQVSPQEAVMLFNNDALMLDVRENSEYADGHIPKSRHIPLGQLGKRLSELEKFKDKQIVAVCRSGSRSGHACSMLRKAGFANVSNLAGGITAWNQAGFPKEK
jgi:rhodanese-related sulfurtransferase